MRPLRGVTLAAALVLPILVIVPEAAATPSFSVQLVNINSSGQQQSAYSDPLPFPRISVISSNGRYVAFESETSLSPDDVFPGVDIYVRDTIANTTTAITGLGGTHPSISNDGNLIAFETSAAYDPLDTNGKSDIYAFDRSTGSFKRLSVSSTGTQGSQPSTGPTLSGDGQFVVFASMSPELAPGDSGTSLDVFVSEISRSNTTRMPDHPVSLWAQAERARASLSGDGRYIYYEAYDTAATGQNSPKSGHLFDRQTETLRTKLPLEGKLSGNGAYLAYQSGCGDYAGDLFVLAISSGAVLPVTDFDSGIYICDDMAFSLSDDGRYVALAGTAYGSATETTHIYIRDLQTGGLSRTSSTPNGGVPNARSTLPAISSDGGWVAFTSKASDLVANDTNPNWDFFVAKDFAPAAPVVTSPTSNTLDTIDVLFSGTAEQNTSVKIFNGKTQLGTIPVAADGSFAAYVTLDAGVRAVSIATASQSGHLSDKVFRTLTIDPQTVSAPLPFQGAATSDIRCNNDRVFKPSMSWNTKMEGATGNFSIKSSVNQQLPTPGGVYSRDQCAGVLGAGVYTNDVIHPYLTVPSKGQWQFEVTVRLDSAQTSAQLFLDGTLATPATSKVEASLAAKYVATYETCTPTCSPKGAVSYVTNLGFNGSDWGTGQLTLVNRIDVTDLAGARIGIEVSMNAVAELQGSGSADAAMNGQILSVKIRKAR